MTMASYHYLLQRDQYSHDFSTSVYSHLNYVSPSLYSHSTEFSSLISIGLHEGDYVNDQYLSDFLGRSSGETGCSSHEETCKKIEE